MMSSLRYKPFIQLFLLLLDCSNNILVYKISGEASNVRDALIQIVLRLRDDVLRDRETSGFRNQQPPARSEKSSFFSSSERSSNAAALALTPSFMSSVPQVASVDYDRRPETGMSGGLYGYGSFPVTSKTETSHFLCCLV